MKFANKSFTYSGLPQKRPGSRIEDLVKDITRKKTVNSVGKSKLDWEAYKKENNLEDNLRSNRKDGYLGKEVFLR